MIINSSYLVSAVLMPPLGIWIDNHGRLIHLLLLSIAVGLAGHLLNLLLPDCRDTCWLAVVPYLLYGINNTIQVVVVYGSVPYLVDNSNSYGTAYGILTCLQNVATCLMSILIGYIHDRTPDQGKGYFWLEITFIILRGITFLLTFQILKWDIVTRGGILFSINPQGKME